MGHAETPFLWVGNGFGTSRLKRDLDVLLGSFRLLGHMRWVGIIDRSAKRALLADPGLFVLPLYLENFRLAVARG